MRIEILIALAVTTTLVGCADTSATHHHHETVSLQPSSPRTEAEIGVASWEYRMVGNTARLIGTHRDGSSLGEVTFEYDPATRAMTITAALDRTTRGVFVPHAEGVIPPEMLANDLGEDPLSQQWISALSRDTGAGEAEWTGYAASPCTRGWVATVGTCAAAVATCVGAGAVVYGAATATVLTAGAAAPPSIWAAGAASALCVSAGSGCWLANDSRESACEDPPQMMGMNDSDPDRMMASSDDGTMMMASMSDDPDGDGTGNGTGNDTPGNDMPGNDMPGNNMPPGNNAPPGNDAPPGNNAPPGNDAPPGNNTPPSDDPPANDPPANDPPANDPPADDGSGNDV